MRRSLLNTLLALVVLVTGGLGLSATVGDVSVGDLTVGTSVATASDPIPGCPGADERPVRSPKAVVRGPVILHVKFQDDSSFFRPLGVNETVRIMIRKGTYWFKNATGTMWVYVNNKACIHNLPFEFENGKGIMVAKLKSLLFSNQIFKP